jgi:hypothetical protein
MKMDSNGLKNIYMDLGQIVEAVKLHREDANKLDKKNGTHMGNDLQIAHSALEKAQRHINKVFQAARTTT